MSHVHDGWLDAYARAFPLRSELAFDDAILQLHPSRDQSASSEHRACSRLGAALDEELRQRGRGLSLEAVRLIRERAWFGELPAMPRAVPMHKHLIRWAQTILEDAGGRCVLREEIDDDASEVIHRYRWATLAVPADLLVAAAARALPVVAHVEVLPPELAALLRDGGVAETHLHQNAAQDFAHLWARTMEARALELKGAATQPPFGSLECFRRWLRIARIARLVLGWRLARGGSTVAECAEALVDAVEPGELRSWPRQIAVHLGRLRRGDRSPPEAVPRLLDDGLTTAIRGIPNPRGGSALAALIGGEDEVEAELRLLYRGMRELKDGELATLFWQYVRVRVRTFAWLVQDPGTAGLGWFSEHYARLRVFPTPQHTFEVARELESRGVRLSSLEVRKGWPDDLPECWRVLRHAAETSAEHGIEVGIVLHFIKAGAKERPSENHATGTRFGDWYRKQERALDRLEEALRRRPWLALFVRGFDVANEELLVPTWVVAPLFRRARAIGRDAARVLARDPSVPRADFRATAHAGEEFRTPAEGLRRIDEIIRYGELRRGDRLGHALALAADPVAWAARNPFILQPAEERLHDLLWELDLRRRGMLEPDGDRVPMIEHAVAELLCHEVLPGVKDVEGALRLRKQLFDDVALQRAGFTGDRAPREDDSLDSYLSNDGSAARGRAPVRVRLEPELSALRQLRKYVWCRVAGQALTVEMNMSSNVLIGDLGSVDGHPALAFREPPDGLPPLAVSVNDDDPLTFATSLPDEYAYHYAQKRAERLRRADALEWIESIRRDGLLSRFTLDLTGKDVLLRELAR